VAVTLVLLLSAGLFLRSLRQSQLVNPGFDAERVLTVPLDINLLRYTTEQGRRFYRDAIERVEAPPGVESASLTRYGRPATRRRSPPSRRARSTRSRRTSPPPALER
jgi:hypothetical protein